MDKSLWEVMQSGGVAMWVIGACSILAVAVAFDLAPPAPKPGS